MWKRLGVWSLIGLSFLSFAAFATWIGVRFQQGAIIGVTVFAVIIVVIVALSSKRMMDGENVMRTSILAAVMFVAVIWAAHYIHTGWMWQFIKTHVLR